MVWKLLLLCLISGHPWSSVYMSVFIADVRQSPVLLPRKDLRVCSSPFQTLCMYWFSDYGLVHGEKSFLELTFQST